jgi:hypothetical protein
MPALRSGKEDGSDSESRSRLEPLLDFFVYIPVGIAVTAAEELPKLAARGRVEIGGRLAKAKMMGRVATGRGRRDHIRRTVPVRGGPDSERPGPASRPIVEPGADDRVADAIPGIADEGSTAGSPSSAAMNPAGADEGVGENAASSASTRPADEEVGDAGPVSPSAPVGPGAAPVRHSAPLTPSEPVSSGGQVPSVDSLAIPGYDSLAASQVVPRLAGLTSEELVAVGDYEAAHRRRTTILTRIRQLQGH